MLLLAVLVTFSVPLVCRLTGVNGPVKIVVWFFVGAQVVGIYVRAFVTNTGLDSFMGPWQPSTSSISSALRVLILYNISFLTGILFIHVVKLRWRKPRLTVSHQKLVTDRSRRILSSKGMIITLFICSLPGLLVLATHYHHSLLNDTHISADRTKTQGKGPLILISEIPYSAMVVWYSFTKGRVRWAWWGSLCFLFIVSLMGGSRSQTLDFVIVLLFLSVFHKRLKLKIKSTIALGILGLVLMYAGWIVLFIRGRMHAYGGSFAYWLAQSVTFSPWHAFFQLLRLSFNGWDGLVSVVGTVPQTLPYHVGELFRQSLTILVPRAVWHSKWNVDIVSMFTQTVWGWGSGGNFVTGAGALYLDSGLVGVAVGALFLGVVTGLTGVLKSDFQSHNWLGKTLFAIWCFFITRFTFAGGPMDADLAGSMLIEVLIIWIMSRPLRTIIPVKLNQSSADAEIDVTPGKEDLPPKPNVI